MAERKSNVNTAERKPFPRDIAEFENDDRISFSKLDDKYLLVDENTVEWEFNSAAQAWTQCVDELEFERNRAAFDSTFGPIVNAQEAPQVISHKRKAAVDAQNAKKKQKQPNNRAVYISNLPLNTTEDELDDVFTRAAGVIDTGNDNKKRITMYHNKEDGTFKGDALIVFFKRESVGQAIAWLDGMPLRVGDTSGPPMKVQEADSSYKKGPVTQSSGKEKKKAIAHVQNQQRKLDEWSDDEPSAVPTQASKWDKVAIMKKMFTLKELDEDPALLLDLKEEVRERAEACGEVTNVVLYDREEDGIVSVRFKTADAATEFVKRNHNTPMETEEGNWRIEVSIATTRPRFKMSGKGTESDEEEEANRLEKFGASLEGQSR